MHSDSKDSAHFDGKSVIEHLKKARTKGSVAAAETHGTEMPGHISAAADAAKETTIAIVLIWAACSSLSHHFLLVTLTCFSAGWLLWKVGRSATLGWSRLERLHRLIEEERWEIEHHRLQEREELMEMYRIKGLEGKLLEEVTDVLMADDNRLLRVMLEEELGLTLEAYEHPLKQAAGAAIGTLLAAVVAISGYMIHAEFGLPLAALCVIGAAATVGAKFERNRVLPTLIWNLAIGLLAFGITYFLLASLR